MSPVASEIEIKLRIEDPAKLLAALKSLGARAAGRVFEHNTLYDTPSEHLRQTRCLLRVREEFPAAAKGVRAGARRTVLTWKAPLANEKKSRYKQKFEREVVAEGRRDWAKTMRSLCLRPTFEYEKYRTTYRWRGLHLDLDETPVGVFLEIEGAPAAIDRAAKLLGFGPGDYSRETYWDLYVAECKLRGETPGDMLFRHQNSERTSVFA